MIRTRIISEIVGSPEEHVNKTTDLLLNKIKEKKDLKISNERKFKAEKMEGNPLYSAFIEYEVEFQKLESLIGFCFDFMPSSIEILEPKEVNIPATNAADLFNELLAQLHQNDLFLRNMAAELKMLKNLNNK